ncbi:MAG: M48 family metalloprotease [Janthinobacterium lividum]
MTTKPRHPLEQSVLLAVLTLPLIFIGLGAWEMWRGWHTLSAGENTEPEVLVARLRLAPAALAVLGGLVAGGAGLTGMGTVAASARQGARSRPALVASFHRVSRVLPLLLAAQVIGLTVAVLSASVFEASGLWLAPETDDRTALLTLMGLVYAGVALWGGYATMRALRRALGLFELHPTPLAGFAVSETDAPGLFALLSDLARERGTTVPETVVVGARNGFFVSALPRLLEGPPGAAPTATVGRTLHLPLAGLVALDPMELRTVLAHELAHFSGDDLQYSVRFQPLYRGLGQAAAAMSVRGLNWGDTLPDRLLERVVHPHSALAVHAYDRFDRVVAQWSRRRELDADRAAIASGSAAALASSLLRVGLVTDLNNRVLRCIAEEPDTAFFEEGTTLSEDLVYRIEVGEAGDPAAHLDDRAPHPTDTHPPDRQRIEAAGITIDDALMARAARPVAPAEFAVAQGLFRDWECLSKDISAGLQDEARQMLARYREHLQIRAGRTNPSVTVLHEALLRPTLLLAVLGAVCLVVAVGCILSALYGGEQDRQAWRLLAGIAVFGAIGFGFVVSWIVRLWRGRPEPNLVLSAEGVVSPGFVGTLRWLDIQAVSVSVLPVRIELLLRRDVPMPTRTRRIRRLQHDVRQHGLQFAGMLPRGMSAAALQATLLQRAQAAHARNRLDAPPV